ncbi:hypothetical protein F8566_20035 [Actinomadura rudentiformis]|uniref:Phosphoadenosine phosphosulfate reductase family protein n=1 Tax=Actinomadura rudentiformis TaxID=359158 RepID=A0A6H9YKH9_9ACTN|nr:hypothetical protein F8566_20035 [Actinomadura rudentiformis]
MLSLGAGVQSTALYLLACEGRIGRFDAAIFADTGWETRATQTHLARLKAVGGDIPIHDVSQGNIRSDALDPDRDFVSMPVFYITDEGQSGMGQRQCTNKYKLRPIKREVRRLLGYPHPARIPAHVYADVAVGFSKDEIGRVGGSGRRYLNNVHPLLDLDGSADGGQGWTRKDCERYLRSQGWTEVSKSACVGCPLHGPAQWRTLRDNDPGGWADAIAFDKAIRHARPGRPGRQQFLHRSLLPLDEAPIDRVSRREWQDRQVDLLDVIADEAAESGDLDGCGPWMCRSGQAVSR